MNASLDTVEHLENQAVALSDKFNKAETDFPTRTIPKGMEIHSLESKMKNRNQYRANLETGSIDDFAKYFKKFDGQNCFINAEDMKAKSIFDIGTAENPLHCKHTASLELKKSAAFKALGNLSHNTFTQRELTDWIEEWHDFITPLEDTVEKKSMTMAKAVKSIRNLTIESKTKSDHNDATFSSRKTTMQEVEAKSEDGLPGYFTFSCVPYDGLNKQTFDLRMSIKTSHDVPFFGLKVMREESIAEDLAKEFQEKLSKEIDCSDTYIGSLQV